MPGYQYLTLGAARQILAARLEDTGLVYYSGGNGAGSPLELNQYIVQAVRGWQCYTNSYRQRVEFPTAANTPFYDLTTVISPPALAHTVTDAEIVRLMLAMLLEPPLAASWTGSGMFTFPAIAQALQGRLNRFLGDTGLGVTRIVIPAGTTPPVDRQFLPDTVLDVRRAAWLSGLAATPATLWRDDQFAMQSFAFGGAATPADPPQVYGLSTLPPIGLQTFPPPANPGQLDLLVVQAGVQVNTGPTSMFNTPVTLNLYNDYSWAVALGAISDLLSNDSPGRDPARAAYCEQRYQEAVALARMAPTVMLAQVNGVPAWAGSVFELDAFLPAWQSTPGAPSFVGLGGRSIAAVGTLPDGVYGITLDLVSVIPAPAADADFLQVDRGNLDAVLDYAQHLASFKLGGAEFAATEQLYKNFLMAAGVENGRLKQTAFYQQIMLGTAKKQAGEVVRV